MRKIAIALALLAPGCTTAYAAGAAVAVAGAAVLTHACYDFVDVQVLDAATGSRICDADVTATRDGSTSELAGCYHAHLSDGTWLIRAARPGYTETTTRIVVSHPDDCERSVQSVNLSLLPIGYVAAPPAPPAAAATAAPPPASSAAPAPAPAPAPTLSPAPQTPPEPATE